MSLAGFHQIETTDYGLESVEQLDANCPDRPGSESCNSRNSLSDRILSAITNMTTENHTTSILVDGNYTAPADNVVLSEQYFPKQIRISVVCVSLCVLSTNFTFFSRYFHKNLHLTFHNVTFKNSDIVVQNIALAFFNVVFEDSSVSDMPPFPGEFGEIQLIFRTCFLESLAGSGLTGIELHHTFTSLIQFQNSQLFNVKIIVRDSTSVSFNSSHSRYFSTQLKFVEASLCVFSLFGDVFQGSYTSTTAHTSLELSASRILAGMKFSTFRNSQGALSITKPDSGLLNSWMQIKVDTCDFLDNSKAGSGAAISVLYFIPQRRSSRQTFFEILNSNFSGNIAKQRGFSRSFGGAVFLATEGEDKGTDKTNRQVYMQVVGSSFIENLAEHGGGAIYSSSEFVFVEISDSIFRIQKQTENLLPGVFVYASGSCSIENTSLIVSNKAPTTSLLELEMNSHDNWIRRLDMSVLCPAWQQLKIIQEFSVSETTGEQRLQRALVSCVSCPSALYVNSDGQFSVSYTPPERQKLAIFDSAMQNFDQNCTQCPTGADCPGDSLLSKPNFWGVRSATGVVFLQCPVEYCCQQKPCESYDRCSGNRVGTLCGMCKDGFSLSVLSQNCVPTDDCGNNWFWFLSIISICSYMLWYTFKGDILAVPICLTDKLYQQFRKQSQIPHQLEEMNYFAIMTFFAQVSALMRFSNFQETERTIDTTFQKIESYLGLILSIELSYVSVPMCVLENMTTTTKTMLKLLSLFGIYMVWSIIFLVTMLFFCSKSNRAKGNHIIELFQQKLIFGLVEIIKYTYLGFTFVTFYSLTCVSIHVTNNLHQKTGERSIWFYDGSVQCYSTWQIAMIVFGFLFVVPYPVALYFGLKLLKKKQISGSFFVSVFLPFPALVYWSLIFFTQTRRNKKTAIEVNLDRNNGQLIYEAFTAGYRESETGTQYWECVVMTRRFLICLTTFIPNPVIKLGTCLGLCVAFLLHHSIVQPFSHRTSNNAESLSLTLLVAVAFINLLRATFLYLGVSPYGTQVEMMNNLGLLESMFIFVLLVYIVVGELLEKATVQLRRVMVKRQESESKEEGPGSAVAGSPDQPPAI